MKHQQSIGLVVLGLVLGSILTFMVMSFSKNSTDDAPLDTAKKEMAVDALEPQDTALELEKETFSREIGGDCVLSGRVLSTNDDPIANASVGIWLMDQPWSSPQPPVEVESDDAGQFQLSGIDEALPVMLYAAKSGYVPATLKKPACNTRLKLEMERGGGLTIQVINKSKEPVATAEVVIAGDSIWPPRLGITDSNGVLEVFGVPSGQYQLWGTHNQRVGSKTFDVESLEELTDISFSLLEVARSTLDVVDTDGKSPVKGVPFFVSPGGMPLLKQIGVTDDKGNLFVRCPSAAGCNFELGPHPSAEMISVTVPTGETQQVLLDKGATVSGTVTDSDGFPIPGASLSVLEHIGRNMVSSRNEKADALLGRLVTSAVNGWPSLIKGKEGLFLGPIRLSIPNIPCKYCKADLQNTLPSLVTDEAGRFVLQGLPSRIVSLVTEHPEMVMVGQPVQVDLSVEKEVARLSLKMRRGSVATIRVVDERGIPITGAGVMVYNTDRELLRDGKSDNDGYAEFKGLPGDIRIEATHEAYVSTVSNIDGRTGVVLDLTLALSPADKILRGRVNDQRGFGVGGADVVAKSIERGHPHVLTGVTAEDGSFELNGAGKGRYCVRADAGKQGRAFVAQFDFKEETKLVLGSGAASEEEAHAGYTIIEPDNASGFAANTSPADTLGGAAPVGIGADNLGVTSSDEETPSVATHSTTFGDADELPVTGPSLGNGGLPIKIGAKGGSVVVTAVSKGSRVAIAGLTTGCRILSVDGHPVRGPSDAKKAIAGSIGSVVMLEVTEPEGDAPFTIVVQRVPAR